MISFTVEFPLIWIFGLLLKKFDTINKTMRVTLSSWCG